MPYSSNSDLPETVRSRYSDNCQSVWRHTFNSVLEDYGDEHRAYASATGQANKCQEKKSMTGNDETKFKIFAPLLKSSRDADGKKRLHGIASSTIKDRHGDTMSLSALSDMEQSANQSLTIFLNHSYTVPEDVAGFVERAQIRQHPQDGEIHDLVLDIVVNEMNERAVNAWEAIQNGTQLGLSIGAMIPDGGATRDKKTGAYQIDHVALLETSIVGVPANPRSWVEYAVKSLNGIAERSDGEVGVLVDEMTPDEAGHPEDPTEDAETPGVAEPGQTSDELSADPRASVGGEQIEDIDTGPPEPDKTDATVNIETPFANITVDTGNRGSGKPAATEGEASQEAQLSAPESEDQDEAVSPFAGILPVQSALDEVDVKTALEMLEPSVVASLRNSTEVLKAITRELIDTRAALKERNDEYEALEEMTKKVLTNTAQILNGVSNTPAGRRAVIKEANEQFSSLQEIYGEEFLKLLKR
jgi:cation transport regulator ChaB/Ni,Fe-hydrogenase III small subunit